MEAGKSKMRRTRGGGGTAALALCVVVLFCRAGGTRVAAVGTKMGSVDFPMLEPLREDERQPPPDFSAFLAKEPGEVPPAPPARLREYSAATMAAMHPKLQRMLERERTMAAFAERYSRAPPPPPPPPPPLSLMNFAAPRVSRIVPGAERDDVYLNRYHAALHRARAVKAGATEAQASVPHRQAKHWSELMKEQFEAEENRVQVLRSAPPSPDAGSWVDGVWQTASGANLTHLKTATASAPPRSEVLRDWSLGRHDAPLPVAFVTFLPTDPAAGLPEGHLREAAYQRVLYALKTACKLHPHAKVVVLTDHTTRHADLRFLRPYATGFQGSNGVRLPCAVTVHAPPPPPLAGEGDDDEEDRAVTAARRREGGKVQLVEEARYLEELAVEGAKHHVVFFDVKHLFVDTVARVFEHRFDVAFVFRDKDGPGLDAPLDLGMKFVHGGKGNFRGAATLWRDAAAAMPGDCTRASRRSSCDDTALRQVLSDFIPNLEAQRAARKQSGGPADEAVTYLYAKIGRAPMHVRLVPCSLYSAVPGGSFMGGCQPSRLTKVLHIMGTEAKTRVGELFTDVWHGRGDVAVQKAVAAAQARTNAKAHR